MSAPSFTFPPPPPAPPQVSQGYSAHPRPQQGYTDNRNRYPSASRGQHAHRRGNNRGGSRARSFGPSHSSRGHEGYSVGGHSRPLVQDSGYNIQGSDHRGGGYPLPNYPSVQLPQYPANLGQDYGRRPSDYAGQPTSLQPRQAGYHAYEYGSQPYAHEHQPYASRGYPSQGANFQPVAQGFPDPRALFHSSTSPINQPPLMGPPIRMGFDGSRQSHQSEVLPQPTASGTISFQNGLPNGDDLSYRHSSPLGFQSGGHDTIHKHPAHRGRGQKRGQGEANGRQRNQNTRPHAAPAVPSFGGALPLPIKPPVPQDHGRKPRKKKRKHNQLGLTPKTEKHESSEEEDEDDADEESRLAAAVASSDSANQPLQFEYKGRTSTLQSSSDIKAWIEERRKRFPTKARTAEATERKRQLIEAQRAANQARKDFQETRRLGAQEKQRLKTEAEHKRKRPKENVEDATAKAKRKVEKLRRQLEKEEKRVAKAEAKALTGEHQGIKEENESHGAKKRKRSCSAGSSNSRVEDSSTIKVEEPDVTRLNGLGTEATSEPYDNEKVYARTVGDDGSSDAPQKSSEHAHLVANPLTPTSQPPAPEDVAGTQDHFPQSANGGSNQVTHAVSASASNTSSDYSSEDSEDSTSSSGSSSSGSGSDGDAPDQGSSRRNGPERVPPPKREKPKPICNAYLKTGRCKKGDSCIYRHELPERGSRAAARQESKKPQERTDRVSLHQRLVNQEKEKEDEEVLKAIIHLGEKGLLDEAEPQLHS